MILEEQIEKVVKTVRGDDNPNGELIAELAALVREKERAASVRGFKKGEEFQRNKTK